MIEKTEQFQEWLNTQCSDYVLWSEQEMKAAQIGFMAGLEQATTATQEQAAGKCDAEARYWADKAESTLFDSQAQKERIICSLTASNCATAIRKTDDDT